MGRDRDVALCHCLRKTASIVWPADVRHPSNLPSNLSGPSSHRSESIWEAGLWYPLDFRIWSWGVGSGVCSSGLWGADNSHLQGIHNNSALKLFGQRLSSLSPPLSLGLQTDQLTCHSNLAWCGTENMKCFINVIHAPSAFVPWKRQHLWFYNNAWEIIASSLIWLISGTTLLILVWSELLFWGMRQRHVLLQFAHVHFQSGSKCLIQINNYSYSDIRFQGDCLLNPLMMYNLTGISCCPNKLFFSEGGWYQHHAYVVNSFDYAKNFTNLKAYIFIMHSSYSETILPWNGQS